MYRTIIKLARTSQTNRESSLQMGMQIFRDDLFTHADKLHRHRGKLGDFKRQQVFLRFFYNSVHVDDRKLLNWAYIHREINVIFVVELLVGSREGSPIMSQRSLQCWTVN